MARNVEAMIEDKIMAAMLKQINIKEIAAEAVGKINFGSLTTKLAAEINDNIAGALLDSDAMRDALYELAESKAAKNAYKKALENIFTQ